MYTVFSFPTHEDSTKQVRIVKDEDGTFIIQVKPKDMSPWFTQLCYYVHLVDAVIEGAKECHDMDNITLIKYLLDTLERKEKEISKLEDRLEYHRL